jgi:hypothetical protein
MMTATLEAPSTETSTTPDLSDDAPVFPPLVLTDEQYDNLELCLYWAQFADD